MAAVSKRELGDVTAKEFAKLDALLDEVKTKEALTKSMDGLTIKDIVAHRAHWIELFFSWYNDGQAGLEVYFPAKGYKWNDLERYNAQVRVSQAHLRWREARARLRAAHERLTAFISERSEAELYAEPMQGARNHWTTGRWAEAAGPSHYRSATKTIRKRLKELRGMSVS